MVTIHLDKERQLKLTLRGMVAYEEQTGKSLLNGFGMKTMSMKEVAVLMWACLIHEDKELTYDAFLDIVDMGNIESLSDAISECIAESFPDAKEKKQRPLESSPPLG